MHVFVRRVPAALAAALLLLAVACGTSGDSGSSRPRGDDNSNLFVADARAALGASAQRFQQNVESVSAEFSFGMNTSQFKFGAEGDFAYQAPDSMHMTMELSGSGGESSSDGAAFDLSGLGKLEILALGDEIYMKIPFFGSDWIVMSLADLGTDAQSFRELLASHSPFDYSGLLQEIGGEIEDLGEEDGYQHLRFSADIGDVIDALGNSLDSGGTGSDATFADLAGPLTMDVWLDSETLLPDRFEAHGEFDAGVDVADFEMSMRFFGYDEPVDIPDAPEHAQPFADLFSDFKAE